MDAAISQRPGVVRRADLRTSVVPISYMEKEVISRDRDLDLAQLFIGVGSPIVWTAFLLISIWLQS